MKQKRKKKKKIRQTNAKRIDKNTKNKQKQTNM